MRIFALLLTKNEGDVIADCLNAAAAWADRIYVLDGDSSDDTWNIVKALSGDIVIPWKQDGCVFREGLRADIFNAFQGDASEGDWWCQLNADEYYIQDPRAFLENVPRRHHVVWGMNIQYYLTDADLDALDFSKPFTVVRPQLHHYRIESTERRFFRHRRRLCWDPNHAWPRHLGVTHPALLPFRHYPYRSPGQIQDRLDVRRDNRMRGFEGWEHAADLHWSSKIVPAASLQSDAHCRDYVLPANIRAMHLERPLVRAMKHVLHFAGIWP